MAVPAALNVPLSSIHIELKEEGASWKKAPKDTDPRVLEAMQDPDNIAVLKAREYMPLILFRLGDVLFPEQEHNDLKAMKLDLERQQHKVFRSSSCLTSSKCFKVPYVAKIVKVAAIIAIIAIVVIFCLPESVILQNTTDFLPKFLLTSGKSISLGGTLYGGYKKITKDMDAAKAQEKLDNHRTQILDTVKQKRTWFHEHASLSVVDYVHTNPCPDNGTMLGKLHARGLLTEDQRINLAAQNLLLLKYIDIHWEKSRAALKLKLLEIVPEESMANDILSPLDDAVLLITEESYTNSFETGLVGLRKRLKILAGNSMINVLNEARRIQNLEFERRTDPSCTNFYGGKSLVPLRKREKEGEPKEEKVSAPAKSAPAKSTPAKSAPAKTAKKDNATEYKGDGKEHLPTKEDSAKKEAQTRRSSIVAKNPADKKSPGGTVIRASAFATSVGKKAPAKR